MNLEIREMKAAIENYMESIKIPMEVKRMVIREIYDGISRKADEAVSAELTERRKKEEKNAESV